jgi:polyhydroxyalkanoate synthesis regulator phasin
MSEEPTNLSELFQELLKKYNLGNQNKYSAIMEAKKAIVNFIKSKMGELKKEKGKQVAQSATASSRLNRGEIDYKEYTRLRKEAANNHIYSQLVAYEELLGEELLK